MAECFRNRTVNRSRISGASSGNYPPVPPASAPCKCNGNCRSLMQRLQILDFSIADIVLYLDAYPNSAEALAYYHQLMSEREEIKRTLAESCQMPITYLDQKDSAVWNWTQSPWPWQFEAN